MQMTLAKALRQLSEQNNKLQILREQFGDETMFEIPIEQFNQHPTATHIGPGRREQNLVAIKNLQQEIGQLKLRIQLTNVNTQVTYDGTNCSITELLLLVNDLKAQLNLVKSLCSRGRAGRHRHVFGRDEEQIKSLPDYSVDIMREERDRLISEINKLDLFIQQTNFNTELIQ